MPTYSFKCDKCSLRFEKSLKINENHQIKCQSCGHEVSKLPATGVGLKFSEPTKIPKDIDKAVGKDAEKRWMELEEKKKVKEKIRHDSGSEKLSVDFDGNYQPFSMRVDGQEVSGPEATKYRKEMLNDYLTIKKDPETIKNVPSKEDLSKAGS